VSGARTVSLIEDDLENGTEAGTADVTADGAVALELSPFEVRTLRFTLTRA
jgi:alpha-mannosidase